MEKLDVSKLSPEQKVGQMLLARSPINQKDFDYVIDLVKNRCLGGIHISYKHLRDDFPVKSERVFLEKILEAADYPILMCEDMEHGFPKSKVSLPYQLALGSVDDDELCYEYGKVVAIEAKSKGYNLVFGPIVDIAQNPDSCMVGSRSFAGTKEQVARMAAAVIRGYQDQGLVVTAKHYPGFGASPVDSHIGMVYLEGDEDALFENELYPYRYTIEHANLTGVMVGHILAPRVDPKYPATLSPKLIKLLRERAGFKGLIMTDSFAMVGMTNLFPLGECHKLAMKAGNDMVMTSYRITSREAYEYMLDGYKSGMVSEEQITEATKRVIAAQNLTLKPAAQSAVTETQMARAEEMCRKSIAVSLHGTDTPAIKTDEKCLFIIQEGLAYKDPLTGELKQDGSIDVSAAVETLKAEFKNADFVSLPEYPVKPQLEFFLKETMKYQKLILVLRHRTISYTGTSDASKPMISIIDGLRPKLEAIVLFGCPYAAREFGEIKRIIYGFDGAICQKYAALTLAGKHKPTGKLPVKIEDKSIYQGYKIAKI
jgi:beta-glucosidase-like glycosyl hydrolase